MSQIHKHKAEASPSIAYGYDPKFYKIYIWFLFIQQPISNWSRWTIRAINSEKTNQ